jgi:hypothetical protein
MLYVFPLPDVFDKERTVEVPLLLVALNAVCAVPPLNAPVPGAVPPIAPGLASHVAAFVHAGAAVPFSDKNETPAAGLPSIAVVFAAD